MNDEGGAREHGAGLVDRAIAAMRADARRWSVGGEPWLVTPPRPMASDALAGSLPSGRDLPPSVRRWLEFDTTALARAGWLTSGGRFTPRPLDEIATAEWGNDWGGLYAPLAARFDECFLLPGGTDSRRVLATGQADQYGEYPVFAIDIDDLPYIGLMYPGFDVYLAHTLGLLEHDGDGYDALIDHPVYGDRMRQHAANWFAGGTSAEYPF
jgi:hypothetical protein